MSETILVTGGTGFAGSHLVEALLSANEKNIHVTAFRDQPSFVSSLLPKDHIHIVDLTDHSATKTLFEQIKPTQIYHLAAFATVGNSFEQAHTVLDNNVKLQLNVLETARMVVPQSRLLVVGSAMEYDFIAAHTSSGISETCPLGPISPYAISKVLQDLLGVSYGYTYKMDIVRARPFNHIGERQTTDFAIPHFAKEIARIERGQESILRVGNLDAVRDFTDVKDVVLAYILLMNKGQSGDVYNVGSGYGHSMREMVDILRALATTDIPVEIDLQKVRPLDVPVAIADSSKVQALGWHPTIEVRDTLARILNEWRGNV